MKQIVANQTSLFRLAAEQLGDATQWIRIAQLNSYYSPVIASATPLLIPNPRPDAPKGVPS